MVADDINFWPLRASFFPPDSEPPTKNSQLHAARLDIY
jgi:hypothetical protein